MFGVRTFLAPNYLNAMAKIIHPLVLLALISFGAKAQLEVIKPFAAEQSHGELNIDKITFYGDSTVFNLSVTNKLDIGGWFCADKSIYVEDPSTHQRYRIIHSVGIPNCPDVYNFKKKGETLSFSLVFPYIQQGSRTLDLVENCNQSCFNFKGIILDEKLNTDIRTFNQGMELYTNNKINEAITCFTKVIEDIPPFPTHVYGYSFYHLVVIYQNKKDNPAAKYWFDQLEKSSLPDKQYFIDAIRKNNGIPK